MDEKLIVNEDDALHNLIISTFEGGTNEIRLFNNRR